MNEIIAGIILVFWGLGAVLFFVMLHVMKDELPHPPTTPFSLLLLVLAILAWPVTVPPTVLQMKKRGQL